MIPKAIREALFDPKGKKRRYWPWRYRVQAGKVLEQKLIQPDVYDPKSKCKGPRKGVIPPHLKRFLFKKGHRRAGVRKVLDPKSMRSMPRKWFNVMWKGIRRSSDVTEAEAQSHAARIWKTLNPKDRAKAVHAKRYDLPLPQDAHHSGGVIRVVKPFNLAEAQIDVTPKVFTALERTGVFQRMRRGDGTVGLVKRAKSNKGNVNIFVDRRR